MSSGHREVEDKYDVDEDAVVPGLDRLPGVASVQPPVEHLLEATYFDTAGLALASAGITLRRRTGGDDAGWHLKLPVDGARDELHAPLGRSTRTVPQRLRNIVRVYTRDRPLQPVVSLRTHRTVHRLVDGQGRVLAELADDRVTAQVTGDEAGPVPLKAWREWELELVAGARDLLGGAADVLAEAGATPATTGSKLARALGDRLPARLPVTHTPEDSAADVAQSRVTEQVAALRRHDAAVRAGLADGVHQLRVAIRRLRDALATFRPIADRETTEPARAELKWLAGELGPARDLEVQRSRLANRVADLIANGQAELVRGPVSALVDKELTERYERARARAEEALASDRYLALHETLDRLVTEPPWTQDADQPAGDVLRSRVAHDWRRLRSRVDSAADAEDASSRWSRLHEARKAAKRARYAAEPLLPLYGKDARRYVKALKRVQRALGDHHDAVVAQALMRDLSDRAAAAGDNTFTLGVLHADEAGELAACEERFDAAWAKASRKRLRRWLK